MELFLEGDVWSQVDELVDGRNTPTKAAIAYIGKNVRYPFGEDDILVCDASHTSIRSRRTSAAALIDIWDAGASIYSVPQLHAKCLVAGKYSVVGSANLSDNSADHLIECAYVSDRASTKKPVSNFIDALTFRKKPLTRPQLVALSKLPLDPIPPSQVKAKKNRGNGSSQSTRVWAIGTKPFDVQKTTASERSAVAAFESKLDEDVSWIRLSEKSKMRDYAKPGQWLIELSGEARSSEAFVQRPVRIVSRQTAATWTRLYYQTRTESEKLPLSALNRKLKALGLRPIGRWCTRELDATYLEALAKAWSKLRIVDAR